MRTTMVIAMALAATAWATGESRAQGYGSRDLSPRVPFPSPVYRTTPVARYLALQDRQVDSLNQLTAGLQDRYRSQYSNIGGLYEDQYLLARNTLDRQFAKDWIAGARLILDDFQFGRYQHFLEGYGNFNQMLNE